MLTLQASRGDKADSVCRQAADDGDERRVKRKRE
jgi:hypothetical protein